ncbi:MAG: hypothetical protein LAT56_12270 [Wenzhouxiangella sp.]|nr:hypothetical protein [Wenzhouxiangella sp.]
MKTGVELMDLTPGFNTEECAFLCAKTGFDVYQAVKGLSPNEYPSEEVLMSVGFAALSGFPEYNEKTRVALHNASEFLEMAADVKGSLSEHMLASAKEMREKHAGDSARRAVAEARANLNPEFDLSSIFDDLDPK